MIGRPVRKESRNVFQSLIEVFPPWQGWLEGQDQEKLAHPALTHSTSCGAGSEVIPFFTWFPNSSTRMAWEANRTVASLGAVKG